MYAIVDCSGCGQTFKAPAQYAGKRVECPGCRRILQIPSAPILVGPPQAEIKETDPAAAPPISESLRPPETVPTLAEAVTPLPMPPPPPLPPVRAEVIETGQGPVPPGRGGLYAPGQPYSAPPLAVYGTPPAMAHRLTTAPIGQFLLWNFLSFNIFGAVYLNLLHGRMPRLRHNDPSAGQAIGFLFIPFFNLYWMFFTYLRLVERLDEQRAMRAMRPAGLRKLALYNCILTLVCVFLWFLAVPSLVQWLFVFPWFFSQVLRDANALSDVSGQAVEGTDAATIIALAEERAQREFDFAWGGALYVLAGVLAALAAVIGLTALIVAVAPRPAQPDAPDKLPGVICLLFFAALVAVPAVLAYRKGQRMRIQPGA